VAKACHVSLTVTPRLSNPTNVTAGTPFTFTVTAFSSPGVVNTGYNGTVQIFGRDGSAAMPPPATLVSGVGTLTVTLATGPRQTVYAQDAVNAITGASSSINVRPGLQEVGGAARVTIPYAPIGLPMTPTGPGAPLAVASAQRTADAAAQSGSSPTSAPHIENGTTDIAPGAIVDQALANSSASVHDLAVVQSPSGEGQPHWLPNDEWASLDAPAGAGLLGSATDLLSVTSQEQGDVDTVEAFFARNGTRRHSR
jgi:hypothetical protein